MNERLAPHALKQGVQQVPFAAEMIHPTTDPGVGGQSPFVRKSFSISPGGGAKTLRISALGLYRAFINGERVGNDLLTPGCTSYWDRFSYQIYDVSALVRDGESTIDIWLGDGWYRSRMMWPRSVVPRTWPLSSERPPWPRTSIAA